MSGIAKDSSLVSGALRGITGPLVKVPLDSGAIQVVTAGSSTAAISYSVPANPDGSGQGMNMTVATPPLNHSGFRAVVHGRTVGVRWRRQISTPPFDIVVDGVAYAVNGTGFYRNNVAIGYTDYEGYWLLSGLPERAHFVEVHLSSDPTGGGSKTMLVLGWLAERNAVYNNPASPPRSSVGVLASTPATIPTTAGAITSSLLPLIGLHFVNTDAANARTVTVYYPDASSVYATVALAASGISSITFPSARALSGWRWKVDAGATVTGGLETA